MWRGPTWRDWLRERAFRRGLILLPAGERALRFYPRYDMQPSAIAEALDLLRRAVEDVVGGMTTGRTSRGPELRIGTLEARPGTLQAVDLSEDLAKLLPEVWALEVERYGNLALYPPEALKAGRRPLLQYPMETLASTLADPRACGVGLRDRVSQRLLAYALGSPLENHEELGVREDPRYGENDTFYLQALAVSPSVRNRAEVEAMVLDQLRQRVRERGFAAISALIEAHLTETGASWMRDAAVLEVVKDYLHSGVRFVYLQALC
jgi:ribosomal protein S18 acetylase RimI-like enzyme